MVAMTTAFCLHMDCSSSSNQGVMKSCDPHLVTKVHNILKMLPYNIIHNIIIITIWLSRSVGSCSEVQVLFRASGAIMIIRTNLYREQVV